MTWLYYRFSIRASVVLLVASLAVTAASAAQNPDAQQTKEAPAAVTPLDGTIRGTVKAGTIPLPGVSVVATDSVSGKKYAATTDESGTFRLRVPSAASYTLHTEFAAFAPLTQTVTLTTAQPEQTTTFAMQLASRAEAARASASRAAVARGMQSLSLLNSGPDAAPAAGAASTGATEETAAAAGAGDANAATESVAVTGQMGSTNALGNMSEDDIRQRVQDAITQARAQGGQPGDIAHAVGGMLGDMMGGGGGFGGGSGFGGGHGGGGGHGSFRNFNPTQPHGSIFYTGGNSALNTRGFYADGPPATVPSYNSNNYGITLGGSPYIPGLFKPSLKQFVFLNFTGNKSSKQSIYNALVPTDAERSGDFSAAGNNPLYIQNSATPTNVLTCGTAITPINCITPQAKYLMDNFYPRANPNLSTNTKYNYQRVVSPASDSNTIALRYVRNFGQAGGMGGFGGGHGGGGRGAGMPQGLRQNVNGSFNYSHAANDIYTAFPALGGKSATNSLAFGAGYTIGVGRLTNNLSVSWNRTHASTSNYFTGIRNPANDAGLNLGDRNSFDTQDNPLNYGVPGVSFAQFTGFSDTAPSVRVNQTISFSENSSYNKHKHNIHAGFDIRRVHLDTLAGTNVLGSFTFSGYGTCQMSGSPATCVPNTGSDFADFLLGLPQRTDIQASNSKYYLRANVWDVYGQDDWRIKPTLTLNYGLRYEYFSPYSEKYDRLANLDVTFTPTLALAQVSPNQVGMYTGLKYPHSLVYPDRNNISPRFGFAWKPPTKFGKAMVVRGGYGVNYNTGQYGTFALRLANEPPNADTQTNIAGDSGCKSQLSWAITTANATQSPAFNCSASVISNNYAVNPHYRLGYVQIWNFGIQRTLPLQTVLNIDYTGSKGTRLDMVRQPNRSVNGLALATADAFNYEDSVGGSHLSSLAVNLRKRLQHGVALGATYTYSHSIDNASSVGGTTTVIAQDDLNLHAEEGNSSFDVRQSVSGNWQFNLPFGPNTPLLNSGNLLSRVVDGWSFSGNYTFATGTPLTPHFSNLASEISGGSTGSLRPNRVPGASLTAGGGSYQQWFNTGAFTAPAAGSYGNASRNSIPGPGTVSINASLSRTIQMGSTRSLELRAQANNFLNTVQYSGVDTNLNSHTFGQVTSVSSSRTVTVLARYRF
jgi:hypothetical protein